MSQCESDVHIIFTGHSAGGAVASLLFTHFLSKLFSSYDYIFLQDAKLSCVTFGAPPIFTSDIQQLISGMPTGLVKIGLCLSLINHGDPVPRSDNNYVHTILSVLDRSRVIPGTMVGRITSEILQLYCIGSQVMFFVQNADQSVVDEPEDDLLAYQLGQTDLSSYIFANFFAHQMDEYIRMTEMLVLGAFNRGTGLISGLETPLTVDFNTL
jgi:Lipase (class 3)